MTVIFESNRASDVGVVALCIATAVCQDFRVFQVALFPLVLSELNFTV